MAIVVYEDVNELLFLLNAAHWWLLSRGDIDSQTTAVPLEFEISHFGLATGSKKQIDDPVVSEYLTIVPADADLEIMQVAKRWCSDHAFYQVNYVHRSPFSAGVFREKLVVVVHDEALGIMLKLADLPSRLFD